MKIYYTYFILLFILLIIIFYFYKYYKKEPMSSSIIGEQSSGKDFDITVNNYPSFEVLRDKHIDYYRKLTASQKTKCDKRVLSKTDEINILTDETNRLLDVERNLKSERDDYKKLAADEQIEKQRIEDKCKSDREQYIIDYNNTIKNIKSDLKSKCDTKENILNNNWKIKFNDKVGEWQTKYDKRNNQWKTLYDNRNSNWQTKYDNKPCNPKTVNYCSLRNARNVVNRYHARNRRRSRRRRGRRRRRRRRRWSDLHFKYDIKQMGFSPSGIPIVTFKYNDLVPDLTPHVTYQGVLAQQLLPLGLFDHEDEVVVLEDNGFYSVDYDMIDVEFKLV